MKRHFAALLLTIILPCLSSRAGTLTGITYSNFDGATSIFEGQQIEVDNMRIASKATTTKDYVRGTFKFSNTTQSFAPTDFVVFQNVGIFNASGFDNFFALNSVNPIVLKGKGGALYSENEQYNISTLFSPFTATMYVGQVLSFEVSDFTAETRLQVKAPDGSLVFDDIFEGTDSGFITGGLPILQNGLYTITFSAVNGGQSTFMMAYGNANRQKLPIITSGASLSTDLRENLRDYYKYAIYLDAGDQLQTDAPSDEDIRLTLLDATSAIVVNDVGVGLLYIAPTTGYYYIFVSDSRAFGSDYYGTVTVTKPLPAAQAEPAGAAMRIGSHSSPAKPQFPLSTPPNRP